MFVLLTEKAGKNNVLVNMNNIDYIKEYKDGDVVVFVKGKQITVEESLEELENILSRKGVCYVRE